MEFITKNDLLKIGECAGQDIEVHKHAELSVIYHKLEFLCKKIEEKGYRFEIRKDPRKQAGPGRFVFQDYQWAKIYPKKLFNACTGKFAYIVGLNDSLHFHMMGIKEYQDMKPSLDASKQCWTELDFEDSSYEEVANEFVEFDKINRDLFLKTGAALGIEECINLLNKKNMEKIIELLKFKNQIILQGPPGTGKTYSAKNIAYNMVFEDTISTVSETRKKQLEELTKSDQFKLIQFHPSYSYEDFVRGITAKAVGDKIEYKTENKTLAKFAKEANKNFSDYKKDADVVSYEKWFEMKFEEYIVNLESRVDNGTIDLNDTDAFIYPIEQGKKEFDYSVRSFRTNYKVSFKDFFHFYNESRGKEDIIKSPLYFPNQNKYGLTQLIYDFRRFIVQEPEFTDSVKIPLKKYVLIIDEINRTNLSSVLGELIYALEYRDEAVESMYELDGD